MSVLVSTTAVMKFRTPDVRSGVSMDELAKQFKNDLLIHLNVFLAGASDVQVAVECIAKEEKP